MANNAWRARQSGSRVSDCDKTTSEMMGFSPKIMSGDYRRSKNIQIRHI
jgi:hypothetical protein